MVAPLKVEGMPAFRGASGAKYELETKFREYFTISDNTFKTLLRHNAGEGALTG